MPSHKLTLKVGAPVMLLRNINQKKGLCNGTGMILTHVGDRVLKAKLITGSHIGEEVLIPRIVLLYDETKLPFTLRWRSRAQGRDYHWLSHWKRGFDPKNCAFV